MNKVSVPSVLRLIFSREGVVIVDDSNQATVRNFVKVVLVILRKVKEVLTIQPDIIKAMTRNTKKD